MTLTVSTNDFILLRDSTGKVYFGKVEPDRVVNTSFGMVVTEKLVGKNYGEKVETSSGHFLQILKPNFSDIFHRLKRGPQIITLKDASILAAYAGITRGDRVIEAGAGSGALTVYLASLVAPEGKLYTYEIRPDFLQLAKKNLEFASLDKFVELKLGNIYEGIQEEEVNAVILDLPEPWQALDAASKALLPGGALVCYLPTTNQVQQLAADIYNRQDFAPMSVKEVIIRNYQTKPHAIRPESQGLMHTAYLCFSRKV